MRKKESVIMKHMNAKKQYLNPKVELLAITTQEDILTLSPGEVVTLPVETDYDPNQGEWV
jgi:hypothetical protein